jgi:A/G-specific adenine glycosylase
MVFWNPKNTGLQGARVKKAGKTAVVRALLAWYGHARRDLPWRRSQDPYRVWVSEIMLQQTQVERVRDFYDRFLERFPTVAALAAAAEHDVLRLWEGLGYYRRARQLHVAAKTIVADHAGEFPRTVAGLRSLPGIGRYTAGAIASIAFDLPEPIVEANSRRVLARLAGHEGPLGSAAGDEPIWEIAAALVPQRHPGKFNQALMDVGSLVCTPERPLCGTCPLAACCEAKRTGRVAEIPMKAARRPVKEIHETAVVVRRAGRCSSCNVDRASGGRGSGIFQGCQRRQEQRGGRSSGRRCSAASPAARRAGSARSRTRSHTIASRSTWWPAWQAVPGKS